jgi:hypothetical protein
MSNTIEFEKCRKCGERKLVGYHCENCKNIAKEAEIEFKKSSEENFKKCVEQEKILREKERNDEITRQINPNTSLITKMWTITACCFFCGLISFGFKLDITYSIIPLIGDGVACIMALVLIVSRNSDDKMHGIGKLAIEFVLFIIGFMIGLSSTIR